MIRTTGTLCLAFKRCAQRPNTLHVFQIPPYHLVQSGNVVSIFQASCLSSVVTNAESAPGETGNEKTQSKNDLKPKDNTLTPQETGPWVSSKPDENLSKLLNVVEADMSKTAAKELINKIKTMSESGLLGAGYVESDPRYIQLQKLQSSGSVQSDQMVGIELMTVMKVQTLARAVELLQALTVPQQISVMKNLALHAQRTTHVLDAIAKNILTLNNVQLNAKESSDLLFSMASLHYHHKDLLSFISKQLVSGLSSCQKPAVVGSTITSFRLLQWRDEEFLEVAARWMENNIKGFRGPSNFLYTLAMLNYVPTNHQKLFKMIWNDTVNQKPSFSNLVTTVWSLVVLDKADDNHFKYMLNPDNFTNMEQEGLPKLVTALKLLNINAAAMQRKTYKGPYLPEELMKEESLPSSQQKLATVEQLRDMLFSKMDSELYRTFVPTSMGFSIDLICSLKDSGQPVPVTTKENVTRVAVRALNYFDTSQPHGVVIGYKALEQRLLEGVGYKVITFPSHMMAHNVPSSKYHEFFKNEINKALGSPSV